MTVHDGRNESANMLKNLTGSAPPDEIVSTGPDMFIKFVSDFNVTGIGFRIRYKVGKYNFYPL